VLVQTPSLATKIADFGLARQKATGVAAASMMRSMVGTILYSCPEIVQHKPYTHKTDVWALGCLLYKKATLNDPFSGSNPLSVARKIVECDYTPLDTQQHSEMLINTIRQCLTVIPESRPDIRQVCQLITPAFAQHIETLQRALINKPVPSHALCNTPFNGQVAVSAIAATSCSHQASPDDTSPQLVARRKHVDQRSNSFPDGLKESQQSIVSGVSEYSAKSAVSEQSVKTALSVQSAQSAQTVKTAKSSQSEQSQHPHPQEEHATTVQVPLHMLGTVVDPLQRALQVVHQLVFLSQLLAPEASSLVESQHSLLPKRRAVIQYQQWLFGSPQGAAVMKREVSRLMQRSPEPVDCAGPNGEPAAESYTGDLGALSQLTYDTLHNYINDLCVVQGYDTVVPSSVKGGTSCPPSSSSDAYNGR
jgi:serine/threonine protein kinase